MNQIYQDMSNDQLEILEEVLGNTVKSNIYIQNSIGASGNYNRYWMAIFADYLRKYDKKIVLTSGRYYYKQSDLDYYYPTNSNGSSIAGPFCYLENENFQIMFVDTSTGAKIYEYATELCKVKEEYIDRPSLAVSLTKDRTHKIKIIHNNNNVWILSNKFTNDLIEQCLALIPFLFDIKELQEDEKVMNVCKAVAKDEPIKEYFKDIFDSLAEIREKQKLDLIKKALNARITQQTKELERNINRIKDNIETETRRLEEYYNNLEELQLKHIGMLTKKGYDENSVKEVLDFINRNRYIQSLTVKQYYSGYSGEQVNMLLVDIIAPISIYEPEPLDRFINARLEDYGETSIKGKILKAFKRIFVDQELQMICETYVRLDLANADMSASSSSLNLNSYDYKRLCQPHLSRFNCWGDNSNIIKEQLRNGEICEALNSILIAVQNINFTDATVLNSFLDTIAGSDYLLNLKSCMSKADGQLWSIKDIIEQLDRETKAEEPKIEEAEAQEPQF